MTRSAETLILEAFPAVESIRDAGYRAAVITVWARAWEESHWERLEDCPFNPSFPDVSLVSHVNCLLDLALSSATTLEAFTPELRFDRDLLKTGVLLHDVSKIVEIAPGPDGPIFSPLVKAMPHAVYGAHLAMEEGLPEEVVNLILSHTKLTGATPMTNEAVLVHYLDYGMADILRQNRGLPLLMSGKNSYGK